MQDERNKGHDESVLKDKEKFTGDKASHMGSKPSRAEPKSSRRPEDKAKADVKK